MLWTIFGNILTGFIDLLNWVILVLTGFWTMSELTDPSKKLNISLNPVNINLQYIYRIEAK